MYLKSILEAILFASQKPLSNRELREILANTGARSEDEQAKAFQKVKDEEIEAALIELEREHAEAARSYRLFKDGRIFVYFHLMK